MIVVGILPPFGRAAGPKDSPCDSCSVRATDRQPGSVHLCMMDLPQRANCIAPGFLLCPPGTHVSPTTNYRFSLVFSLIGDVDRLLFSPPASISNTAFRVDAYTPSSQTSARRRRNRNLWTPGAVALDYGRRLCSWPGPHATRDPSHQPSTKNGAKLAPLSGGNYCTKMSSSCLDESLAWSVTRALSVVLLNLGIYELSSLGACTWLLCLVLYSELVILGNSTRTPPSPGLR